MEEMTSIITRPVFLRIWGLQTLLLAWVVPSLTLPARTAHVSAVDWACFLAFILPLHLHPGNNTDYVQGELVCVCVVITLRFTS